jgi:cytidylate kinase
VSDGRDVGTTVFPNAPLKVFLTASAEERARRRLLDYGREPGPETIERETAALEARDRADSTRDLSPLRRSEDAVDIDTTRMSPEQVVGRIVELARQRGLSAGPY